MLRCVRSLMLLAAALLNGAAQAQSLPAQQQDLPLSAVEAAAPPAAPRSPKPLEEDGAVREAHELASDHFSKGRLEEAAQRLLPLASAAGRDVFEVQFLLASALARRGDFAGALAPARSAAELQPESVDAQFLLASLLLERGDLAAAIRHYRSATLRGDAELNNPNVTLAWFYLAQLLAGSGAVLAAEEAYAHFDDAIWESHTEQRNVREIQKLLESKPLGALLERLELLRRLGRKAEALRLLESAERRWPENAHVARLRVAGLLEAGEAPQALALADRWLSDVTAIDHFLPQALSAADQSGAVDSFVESIALRAEKGERLDLAAALTPALLARRHFAQAARLGAAALKGGAASPDVVADYADALRLSGDVQGAIAVLADFVRENPAHGDTLRRRVRNWRGGSPMGLLDAAIASRGTDPEAPRDYVLGVLALASGQQALADQMFLESLRAQPDFSPAQLGRARILLDACDWAASKAYAEQLAQAAPGSGVAAFVLAEACDGLDDNDAAENAYKKALKIEPENSSYALALARHYRRLGEWVSAERFFQRALSSDPSNGEALEGLVDAYAGSGKIEIARAEVEAQKSSRFPADVLRRVSTALRFAEAPYGPDHLLELRDQHEQHPEDAKTTLRYALAQLRANQIDAASALLAGVCATLPEDLEPALLLANVQAMRLQFDEAVARLQGFVKRYPNRVVLLDRLARLARFDFQTELARDLLKRLRTLDPENEERHRVDLLNSYLAFGEAEAAVKQIDAWLAEKPDSAELLVTRIDALVIAERQGEAFELVKSRLGADETNDEWRSRFVDVGHAAKAYREVEGKLRGWLDAAAGDLRLTTALILTLIRDKRADEALQVARDFSGGFREALTQRIWLGMCHAEAGRTDDAIAEYQALLRERTLDESQRRVVRGDWRAALARAKRYDEAVALCEGWISEARTTDDAGLLFEALAHKAAVLQTADRQEEYIAAMEAMFELNPGSVSICNDLGYSWIDANRKLEQATNMVRLAVAEEPLNAAYLDSLGWAYYKASDFSNARKYLARAARLRDGQDGVVLEHLGDAEYRLGDIESARRRWKKALEYLEKDALASDRAPDAVRIAGLRQKLSGSTPQPAPTVAEVAGGDAK